MSNKLKKETAPAVPPAKDFTHVLFPYELRLIYLDLLKTLVVVVALFALLAVIAKLTL